MMRTPTRPLVYLFGATISDAEQNAFKVYDIKLEEADAYSSVFLNYSRALIFYADANNHKEVIRLFDEYAVKAAQHGNMLIPCANEPSIQTLLNDHIMSDRYAEVVDGKRKYPDFIAYQFLFRPVIYAGLARDCALWDAGPSANDSLTIDGFSYPLHGQIPIASPLLEEEAVLLQRAFFDCKSIITEKIDEGRSNATVLKVHPSLSAPAYGASTRPMYAKIDILSQIEYEGRQYKAYVEGAIPFFMRPNIIESRCVKPGQGYKKGLLVGNFVENSEPIIKVIKRGAASLPIYSLFDYAFRTWRLGSHVESSISVIESLIKAGCVKPISNIPQEYILQAKRYGLVTAPLDVWTKLQGLPNSPHRVGTIHGDLHPGNIHVRGMESVLIDFCKVGDGPLVYDLAMLEIAIVFQTYPIAQSSLEAWKQLVDTLYSGDAFLYPPEPRDHGHALENLWIVVRQLRSIAPTLEGAGFNYPATIVFCLLRHCAHSGKDLSRAAYGLVIAEKLCSYLNEH